MNIPENNAFKINKLGGASFPFSVKVRTQEGVSSLFICAQRVVDLCDLISRYAKSHLVLFGVDQTSIFERDSECPMPLADLAALAQIPFTAIDDETNLLPKESLFQLLSTFDHHNLNLFDVDRDWDENRVISQVLAYQENNWQQQQPLLLKMPSSNLFLTSHDDCYLTVESRDNHVSKEIFSRTLQIYAGNYLDASINLELELPDIPMKLLHTFWQETFGLTILGQNTEITNHQLIIGLSFKPFDFAQPDLYPPESWLVYDMDDHTWLR